ncbi:two component transcriptional regulator, LuxR family [Rhodospirillales bacterium URHD0017]|nr:two component transcriptional regulator, LuxR family [Rhodospirillales bacterium URHD0017]
MRDLQPVFAMKILVVDDHVLIREALRGLFKELRPEATVLEAPDAARTMQLLAEQPDIALVLLDLSLPDRDGLALLAEVHGRHPGIPVVVLSGFADRANVVRALDHGALGFIPKSAGREVMTSALSLVFSGGVYIPPEILGPGPNAGRAKATPGDLGLTERQVDVLALMMQGKSNKAICRRLDLAEPTVKNHVTAILKALGVSNRTEAVLAVSARGWQFSGRHAGAD